MSRLRGSWLLASALLGFTLLAVAFITGREIYVTLDSYGAAGSHHLFGRILDLATVACASLGALGAVQCGRALRSQRGRFFTLAAALALGGGIQLLDAELAMICFGAGSIVFASIALRETTHQHDELGAWLVVIAVGLIAYMLADDTGSSLVAKQSWLRVLGYVLALAFWLSWLALVVAWLGAFADASVPVATVGSHARVFAAAASLLLCSSGIAIAAVAAWATEQISSDQYTWGTLVLGITVFVAGLVPLSRTRGKPLSTASIMAIAIALSVAGCLLLHQRAREVDEIELETHSLQGFSIALPAGTLERSSSTVQLRAKHVQLGVIVIEAMPTAVGDFPPLAPMQWRCRDHTYWLFIHFLGKPLDSRFAALRKRVRKSVTCQ